jgi:energy-coupling factor transporter ATP-binding protein EcfA2
MITRFYANNYKCLVNFSYEPRPFELILGANGSGKTTFTEALAAVRSLVVEGSRAEEVFQSRTLTQWQSLDGQSFELELDDGSSGGGEKFHYSLEVEHWSRKGTSHVTREELSSDGTRLFLFDGKDVHLFRDDGTSGPQVPAAWDRSPLGGVPSGPSNTRLIRFRTLLSQIYRVRLNPFNMVSLSEREDAQPTYDLSNLASWYRHLSQEDPESISRLWESLKQVMPCFEIISLSAAGTDRREFTVKMGSQNVNGGQLSPAMSFVLEELSEGQRALISLYLLLHCGVRPGTTLLIDEPENFIAPREWQPWLFELQDRVEESGGQALLISHNPEFINQMAPENAVLFRRPSNLHSIPSAFPSEGFEGLLPSQVLSRGWDQAGVE